MVIIEKHIRLIKDILKESKLDVDLIRRFNKIINQSPSNQEEYAHDSSALRTFLENLTIDLAKKIMELKKNQKHSNQLSYPKARLWLEKNKIVTNTEMKLINTTYDFLNAYGGSHKLSTLKEKYELMLNMTIESTFLLLDKSQTYLIQKSTKRITPPMSKEQFERLINATLKLHHKLAFLLLFGSGLKISELMKLKKEDFNLQEMTILVKSEESVNERIVPLDRRFKKEHLEEIPLKCGIRALQKAFKFYAEKSGLLDEKSNFVLESLRKGFAKQLLSRNIPHHEIKELLGHKTIGHTGIYLDEIRIDKENSFEAVI